MLQLVFQTILLSFLVNWRKPRMAKRYFPLQCFVHKESLTNTAATIYCHKL